MDNREHAKILANNISQTALETTLESLLDKVERLGAENTKLKDQLNLVDGPRTVCRPNLTWQPIETAPKDGSHFLVAEAISVYDIPCIGYYCQRFNRFEYWVDSDWYDVEGYGCAAPNELSTPTHWMPLPELPKKKEE